MLLDDARTPFGVAPRLPWRWLSHHVDPAFGGDGEKAEAQESTELLHARVVLPSTPPLGGAEREPEFRDPHHVVLAVPYRVTAWLRILHNRSVASRSPKGEGFTDPRIGTLNADWRSRMTIASIGGAISAASVSPASRKGALRNSPGQRETSQGGNCAREGVGNSSRRPRVFASKNWKRSEQCLKSETPTLPRRGPKTMPSCRIRWVRDATFALASVCARAGTPRAGCSMFLRLFALRARG